MTRETIEATARSGRVLIIRSDADSLIGTGHVMRTLALAQAFQDQGGQAVFITCCAGTSLGQRLVSEGVMVEPVKELRGSAEDALNTVCLARDAGADWIIADGYDFGCEFQRLIKEAGLYLLLVDDFGSLECFNSDIVMNQNPSARESMYSSRGPDCRLLLGTDYALLRRDFLRLKGWRREITETGKRLLVTMGGADSENVTSHVLSELRNLEIDGLEITVVAGGANRHYEKLLDMTQSRDERIRLICDVKDMSELMVWADVAISAGGSTCWEMAFLGLPNLILVLADNQAESAAELERLGVSINLGRPACSTGDILRENLGALLLSQEKRAAMSSRGRLLVDGNGPGRVLRELNR
jgi:UDP-2,4-diacetamido-2,4,6-trideoxy-beta-L-altropyranose hydrolase